MDTNFSLFSPSFPPSNPFGFSLMEEATSPVNTSPLMSDNQAKVDALVLKINALSFEKKEEEPPQAAKPSMVEETPQAKPSMAEETPQAAKPSTVEETPRAAKPSTVEETPQAAKPSIVKAPEAANQPLKKAEVLTRACPNRSFSSLDRKGERGEMRRISAKTTLCYHTLFGKCQSKPCFHAHDSSELVPTPVNKLYKTEF